jgi:hypothetical protein
MTQDRSRVHCHHSIQGPRITTDYMYYSGANNLQMAHIGVHFCYPHFVVFQLILTSLSFYVTAVFLKTVVSALSINQ